MATTGCTVVALLIPRNNVAPYMAPSTLNKLLSTSLQQNNPFETITSLIRLPTQLKNLGSLETHDP